MTYIVLELAERHGPAQIWNYHRTSETGLAAGEVMWYINILKCNAMCYISLQDMSMDLEKLWIVGDNFCHNSFDKYFKEDTSVNTESDITSFTFKNFEVF